MPVASTMKPRTIGIISSHRIVGVTPLASANTNTTMKFMPRLNVAVSDTDSGTTIRGKRIFLQHRLASDEAGDGVTGRLGEVGPQDDRGQQVRAVVAGPRAMWMILTKNTYRTPKNSSGRISDHT